MLLDSLLVAFEFLDYSRFDFRLNGQVFSGCLGGWSQRITDQVHGYRR